MKILLVSNTWEPYQGGVVQSIRTTKKALEQEGHSVLLITFDYVGTDTHDPTLILLKPLLCFSFNKNRYLIPTVMYQHEIEKQITLFAPDVVHVHHPFLLGYKAARCAYKKNIPVIFTYHSLYQDYAQAYAPFAAHFFKKIIQKMIQRFLRFVTVIIAPTQSVKVLITQQYTLKNIQIVVIPSAIRDCFFTHKKKAALHTPIRLLTVARLRKEKNIEALFYVVRNLSIPFVYTIAGYGDLEKYLKQKAQELGLSNKICFVIKPSQAQLVDLYAQNDIFIFASKTETQGLVLAESMASGTPVIAYAASGIRDCVISDYNGYVVATQKEFATRIVHVAQDEKLYKKLFQGALVSAKSYTMQAVVKQYSNLYKSLL